METQSLPVPDLISVDDHVLEHPDLWTSRLPAKFKEQGPKVIRQKVKRTSNGRGGELFTYEVSDEGRWCDVWYYEDKWLMPLMGMYAAMGGKNPGLSPVTFEDVADAAWIQKDRLAAMDENHVEAALCFPNTVPRFCGQTFFEGSDHELGLACIRAYNDWIHDEWGAGDGRGRLIGATIFPLWDPVAAAEEIRRCADRDAVAVSFPENPHPLGLPSINDRDGYWDPVFRACEETNSVLCMHIGSSSKLPSTSPDAPFQISTVLIAQNAQGALCDFIYSKTLERFPELKLCFSEAQVGWAPYLLERMDRQATRANSGLKNLPSEYVRGRVYGCIFDDVHGLKTHADGLGIDQICYETDYPHAESTWPESREVLGRLSANAGLTEEQVYKVARGNAITAFDLARIGIRN